MLKNPFSGLKKHEWALWIISLITVIISDIAAVAAGNASFSTVAGTAVGVTALIFVARGDVWGQVLTVVFSFLYAVTSLEFRYWGEIITYLGMSMPIAAMSVVSWLRHPYEHGKNEVKIHKLTKPQIAVMIIFAAVITTLLHFVLKALNTPNLFFSTVSVTTSFLASYLMFYRNSYYAVAYAANDIVLIILWVLASIKDFSYFPMIICFFIFFINDMYGFVSWKLREKKQHLGARK